MKTRRNQNRSNHKTLRCKPGEILRAPYVRRYSQRYRNKGVYVHRGNKTVKLEVPSGSIHVPAQCIKNRGLPGKGPRPGQVSIGNLKKGDLSKHGYGAKLPEKDRHEALIKAIQEYGTLSTYRKLDAVAKYSMRTAPEFSHIFAKDRDWIRRTFHIKKGELKMKH